jgi:hypothetical protein
MPRVRAALRLDSTGRTGSATIPVTSKVDGRGDRDTLLGRQGLEGVAHVFDEGGHVHRLRPKLERPRLHLRQVEQLSLRSCCAAQDVAEVLLVVGEANGAAERRAKLV